MDAFEKAVAEAQEAIAMRIEEKIKVRIRPAPRWCPAKLWIFIAAQFIYLEETRP